MNAKILASGELWRGKSMQIRWLPGVPVTVWQQYKERSPQGLYIGSFVSAKHAKRAVDRNRMRRRCKEAFRIVVRDMKEFPSAQLLLAPRSSSLTCDYADILSDVRSFLSFLSPCLSKRKSGAIS